MSYNLRLHDIFAMVGGLFMAYFLLFFSTMADIRSLLA